MNSQKFVCFAALAAFVSIVGCHRDAPTRVAVNVPPKPLKPILKKAPPPSAPAITPSLSNFKPKAAQLIVAKDRSGVALTFDAGSDDRAVGPILKELQARRVQATFFLTGRFCEQFPKSCRAIADAGMEIGHHSYSHPHFPKLTDAQIKTQMERGEAAITKACGRGAKPLFRFPYGDFNPRVCKTVAALGYQPVYWTLDSLDAFGERKSADFVTNRINNRVKGGYILLMHVSSVGSAQALPRIFTHLDAIKAKPVTIGQMMNDE